MLRIFKYGNNLFVMFRFFPVMLQDISQLPLLISRRLSLYPASLRSISPTHLTRDYSVSDKFGEENYSAISQN
jgi:hypothetical protein